jgi:alkanesulfonate monooxygenase SsuD/methylene tetrahydromethanopterin reductase-like flavin-dependent oxidoreductase (luciferase family)
LRNEEPVSFDGAFYQLHNAVLMPNPPITRGLPLVIGGNGPNRTLPLVARYADEWNAVFVPAKRFVELNTHLDELLRAAERSPEWVRRTLMTRVIFGRTVAEVARKLGGEPRERLRARGIIVGTSPEVVEQLGSLAEAGVQWGMLQWLEVDNLDGLEEFARSVLSQL